ncbi:MAG: hypothetical protein JWO02_4583 [Solirubrobacterales bacterium]|nr:hypothetical protein [Solirubrobacterales bacterium]
MSRPASRTARVSSTSRGRRWVWISRSAAARRHDVIGAGAFLRVYRFVVLGGGSTDGAVLLRERLQPAAGLGCGLKAQQVRAVLLAQQREALLEFGKDAQAGLNLTQPSPDGAALPLKGIGSCPRGAERVDGGPAAPIEVDQLALGDGDVLDLGGFIVALALKLTQQLLRELRSSGLTDLRSFRVLVRHDGRVVLASEHEAEHPILDGPAPTRPGRRPDDVEPGRWRWADTRPAPLPQASEDSWPLRLVEVSQPLPEPSAWGRDPSAPGQSGSCAGHEAIPPARPSREDGMHT